jgi:mRNA interferase YafQ
MRRLVSEEPLAARHLAHPLRGKWDGFLECHIQPDWLLIWYSTAAEIVFVRTGTHADLFE